MDIFNCDFHISCAPNKLICAIFSVCEFIQSTTMRNIITLLLLYIKLAFQHVFVRACLFLHTFGLGGSNSFLMHGYFLQEILQFFNLCDSQFTIEIAEGYSQILYILKSASMEMSNEVFYYFFSVAHLAIFNGLHIFRHIS